MNTKTNSSPLLCSFFHQITFGCITKGCKSSSPLVCQNSECENNKQHSNCWNLIQMSQFKNRIRQKGKIYNQLLQRRYQWCDQLIKKITICKDQLAKTIDEGIYGLFTSQAQFYKNINSGDNEKISISKFQEILKCKFSDEQLKKNIEQAQKQLEIQTLFFNNHIKLILRDIIQPFRRYKKHFQEKTINEKQIQYPLRLIENISPFDTLQLLNKSHVIKIRKGHYQKNQKQKVVSRGGGLFGSFPQQIAQCSLFLQPSDEFVIETPQTFFFEIPLDLKFQFIGQLHIAYLNEEITKNALINLVNLQTLIIDCPTFCQQMNDTCVMIIDAKLQKLLRIQCTNCNITNIGAYILRRLLISQDSFQSTFKNCALNWNEYKTLQCRTSLFA